MIARLFHIVRGALRERAKSKDRSPRWPSVRHRFLAANPRCAACGGRRLMQVHHVEPFHEHPDLELDPDNLIGLCQWRLCHLEIGHGGNFKSHNPEVEADAARCLADPSRRREIADRARICRMGLP